MTSQGGLSSSSEIIDLPDVKIHHRSTPSSHLPPFVASFLSPSLARHLSSLISFVLRDAQGRKLGVNAGLRFCLFLYSFILSSTLEWLVLAAFSYRAFYDFMVAFTALLQTGMRSGAFGLFNDVNNYTVIYTT